MGPSHNHLKANHRDHCHYACVYPAALPSREDAVKRQGLRKIWKRDLCIPDFKSAETIMGECIQYIHTGYSYD